MLSNNNMKINRDVIIQSTRVGNSLQLPILEEIQSIPPSNLIYSNELNTVLFGTQNSVLVPNTKMFDDNICTCGYVESSNTAYRTIIDGFGTDVNYRLTLESSKNLCSIRSTESEFYDGVDNLILTTQIDPTTDFDFTSRLSIYSSENLIIGRTEFSSIINGTNSRIQQSNKVSLYSTKDTFVDNCLECSVYSGLNNRILTDTILNGFCTIVNGKNNTIQDGRNFLILNGIDNQLRGDTPINTFRNAILNGSKNRINGPATYSVILNGGLNTLFNASYSLTMNGQSNQMVNCDNSLIENGYENAILNAGTQIFLEGCSITNGVRNRINCTPDTRDHYTCSIENGVQNSITNAYISMIVNGVSNTLGGGTQGGGGTPAQNGSTTKSLIVTGERNTIASTTRGNSGGNLFGNNMRQATTILNGTGNFISGNPIEGKREDWTILFNGSENSITEVFEVTSNLVRNSNAIYNGRQNSVAGFGYILNGRTNTIRISSKDHGFITNGNLNRIEISESSNSNPSVHGIINGLNNTIFHERVTNDSYSMFHCENVFLDNQQDSICMLNITNKTIDDTTRINSNTTFVPNFNVHSSEHFKRILHYEASNENSVIDVPSYAHIILINLTEQLTNRIEVSLPASRFNINGRELIIKVYQQNSSFTGQLQIFGDSFNLYGTEFFGSFRVPRDSSSVNYSVRLLFCDDQWYVQQISPSSIFPII